MIKRYHFDNDGHYAYGFTPFGFFTLINKDGESLYDQAIPLYEKLEGHLIWIFLWIVLIVVSNLTFSDMVVIFLDRIFMSFVFLHFFLFGCRLTKLLIKGGIKPIFFPPLWMRITRNLQKGGGMDVLKKHRLGEHPGLLVNLALVQFSHNQIYEGRQTLRHALSVCPDHPDILQIFKASAQLSTFDSRD